MTTSPRLAREDAAKPMPRKLRFTREALDAIKCPPGKTAVMVYDTKAPGLQYVVRASGFRRFYWYGKVRGIRSPVRHNIGGDEFSVDLARKRAGECLVMARNGENPNGVMQAKREENRSRRRLGELWENYRRDFLETRGSDKTRATHVSLWNVWLSPWADRAIDTIDGDDIRALHATIAKGRTRAAVKAGEDEQGDDAARSARGAGRRKLGGKRTANKAVALLRRIFNFNKADNPIRPGVVEMFRQHSRERYLTPPELKRFFEALAAEPDQTARDFIELALFTGARRGNVQSMRWDELDLDGKTWTIPAEKTKGGKPIAVPLTSPALEVLERRRHANRKRKDHEPSEFVLWSRRAKAGHITEPKFAFARVCKAAKIRDLRIHDLRRTLGSWQAALGASLPIIGKSLGHANLASTAIYARLNLDPVRASVDGAVAAMMQTAGRTPDGKETP